MPVFEVYSSSPIFHIPGIGRRIYLLPLISGLGVIISLVVCYIIATSLNHCIWFWPYISDFTTCGPENGIFGVVINISGLCASLTYYVRYKLVVENYTKCRVNLRCLLRLLNRVALLMGFLIGVGMSISANFPESGGDFMHPVGGFMAFALAIFYWILQVLIGSCYRLRSLCDGGRTLYRLLLAAAAMTLGQAGGFARKHVSSDLWSQIWDGADNCDNTKIPEESWHRPDNGRYWYAACTMCECLLGVVIAIQNLILAKEFYQISCNFNALELSTRSVEKRRLLDRGSGSHKNDPDIIETSEFFMS